ncbi:MAG: 4-hydroxy-tetrahydrodipicolinate reductase [Thermoplasmata archaeon]
MTRIKLCVVGADGRMGQEIIRAAGDEFEISGAVTHSGSPNEGKSLGDLGLPQRNVRITGPDSLGRLLEGSDVYISFTTPEAEMKNVPIAAGMGKKIVMGTTGFNAEQASRIRNEIEGRTEAVLAPNFSIGINFLAAILSRISSLPAGFDASIVEVHHTGKSDSPSGTALYLADVVKASRGYSKEVHGRSGRGRRAPEEMEIAALRAGGVPGIHEVLIAGPNEMIRMEHTAFSRRVFADGALLAARWIMNSSDRKIHSMREVLGV